MSIHRAEDGKGLGQIWAQESGQEEWGDDFHGLQNVWGLAPREGVSAYVVDYGINVAVRLLMRDIAASGSFMSNQVGRSLEHMGRNSILLRRMQPLLRRSVAWRENPNVDSTQVLQTMRQTLNIVVNEGAMKMDGLSPEGFGYLKVLQGLMGSNLDLHGYDTREDLEESTSILMALTRVGDKYMVGSSDKQAVMSLADTFGRLKSIHITNVDDTYSSGVNMMCLPSDWVERFTKMLNIRVAQTGKVTWPEKGMKVELEASKLDENVAMVGQPESEGEWLMHVARAIRIAVMHGFTPERLDIQSFLDKKPLDTEMNFEEVVGIIDNLVVAHEHNEELTTKLVEALDIQKYFGKAEVDKVRDGLGRADLELFGSEEVVIEDMMWAFEQREAKEYMRLQDMAEMIAKYMPVTSEEFARLVPPPEKRGKVEGEMIGRWSGMAEYNHKARKIYMIDGQRFECQLAEMEAVLALDKMIAYGRAKGVSEDKIRWMQTDRDYLWKLAESVAVEDE